MATIEVIHQIDNNLLAIIILLILLAAAGSWREKGMVQQKLFIAMVMMSILLNGLEILGWIFDAGAGAVGNTAWWLNLLFNMGLYCLVPVPGALWFLYAHYQIHHDGMRLRRAGIIMLLPLLINACLTILSCRTGWLFWIDAGNHYHRGPYFIFHVSLAIGFIGAACLMVLLNRTGLDKRSFQALLLFVIPQLVGSALQIMFYGLTLNWVAMMVSLLIVYLQIQDRGLNMDFLTGTYNRRRFEQIVSNRIRRINIDRSFAVALADMDNFKNINDQFGHQAGDEALQKAVQIIRNSLRKNDLIARFGGDEFYLLMELSDQDDLQKAIHRIYQSFDRFNHDKSQPYQLELSLGGMVYDTEKNLPADKFLRLVDHLMYQEKARRKAGTLAEADQAAGSAG